MKFACIAVLGIDRSELSPAHWARLRASAGRVVDAGADAGALLRTPAQADGLLVDLGRRVDATAMARLPNLRYIGVLGTGFEGVDIHSAAEAGIAVTNVPGYATEAVAEIAIGAVVAQLRGFRPQARGQFDRRGHRPMRHGRELRGRTVGVVGAGRIGARIAHVAKAGFGAKARYWSRKRKPRLDRAGIPFLPLDDILATSEVIFVNLALNAETAGFLNRRRLRSLRRGAVVANFAPMALFETAPLLESLRQQRFSLIMDHAEDLSPRTLAAVRRLPNVEIYPPTSYQTGEARGNREEIFVENVERFARGRPQNRVNRPAPIRSVPDA